MLQLFPINSVEELSAFALVLARLAGLFSGIPLFGGKRVPVKIKAALIMATTLIFFPIVRARLPHMPIDIISILLLVIREALVGVTLSILSQAIFSAVDFCGSIIGVQMGFSISTLFDPSQGVQSSVMSVFQNLLAMLLFLSLGVHHVFIRAIVESYSIIPAGDWHMSSGLMQFLISTTTSMFVLAIRLAAPIMVSLFAASVVLGIMSRSFPQMNVFTMSFPLNIGLGFFILGLSLTIFLHTLETAYASFPSQITTLFRLLAHGKP